MHLLFDDTVNSLPFLILTDFLVADCLRGLWMSCFENCICPYNSSCLHVFDPAAELTPCPWFLNGYFQPLAIQSPVCCFFRFPLLTLYFISLPAQNHFLPVFSLKRSLCCSHSQALIIFGCYSCLHSSWQCGSLYASIRIRMLKCRFLDSPLTNEIRISRSGAWESTFS